MIQSERGRGGRGSDDGSISDPSPPSREQSTRPEVLWHDVECGGYTADLPLWEELAAAGGGEVLELGCGTGRVTLHLARHGHGVLGVDSAPALIVALGERAVGAGRAEARLGDVRELALDRRFALAIAPMQLIQLLSDERDRIECMRSIADHLEDGGRTALAIVESAPSMSSPLPPLPDVREVDGWVYSSLPLDACAEEGSIVIRRLRQAVSPRGVLEDRVDEVRLQRVSADLLEREGEAAGLRPVGRREIPPTEDHVGSTVVLLEAGS